MGLIEAGAVQVEGHDWWPARVVRRRAVPREVGPPPGGSARVRTHIPVVFFTARGIPGEVGDAAHKPALLGAPQMWLLPRASAGCPLSHLGSSGLTQACHHANRATRRLIECHPTALAGTMPFQCLKPASVAIDDVCACPYLEPLSM